MEVRARINTFITLDELLINFIIQKKKIKESINNLYLIRHYMINSDEK